MFNIIFLSNKIPLSLGSKLYLILKLSSLEKFKVPLG